MTEDKKQINALLSLDTIAELEFVKEYYNLQTNSDAMRYLIRQEWRRIKYQPALPGMAQES